jgi:hypothetical protein
MVRGKSMMIPQWMIEKAVNLSGLDNPQPYLRELLSAALKDVEARVSSESNGHASVAPKRLPPVPKRQLPIKRFVINKKSSCPERPADFWFVSWNDFRQLERLRQENRVLLVLQDGNYIPVWEVRYYDPDLLVRHGKDAKNTLVHRLPVLVDDPRFIRVGK